MEEFAIGFLVRLCAIEPDDSVAVNINDLEGDCADVLVDVAQRSGVASWCYFQLSKMKLTSVNALRLQNAFRLYYLSTLTVNQHQLKLFRQIERALNDEGIHVVLLKGMALAFTVYSDEGLRPMGDIDLLVTPDKVFKARNMLLKMGGTAISVPISQWHERTNAHVRAISFGKPPRLIELHSRLFSLGNPFNTGVDRWDVNVLLHQTSYGNVLTLSPGLMGYHLCTHLYYGYLMGGLRLGWLVDIALLFDKSANANELMTQILAVNLAVRKEIIIVLGWTYPLMSQKVREQLKSYTNEFVPFPENAIFLNKESVKNNHRLLVWNELMRTPEWKNKIIGSWFQLFPSFEYMKHYFGAKSRLLLPFYYLKRIFDRK